MNRLNQDEENLLKSICHKHQVNPDHLRILLLIEKDYSFKSNSRSNACRQEIERHIQIWANADGRKS